MREIDSVCISWSLRACISVYTSLSTKVYGDIILSLRLSRAWVNLVFSIEMILIVWIRDVSLFDAAVYSLIISLSDSLFKLRLTFKSSFSSFNSSKAICMSKNNSYWSLCSFIALFAPCFYLVVLPFCSSNLLTILFGYYVYSRLVVVLLLVVNGKTIEFLLMRWIPETFFVLIVSLLIGAPALMSLPKLTRLTSTTLGFDNDRSPVCPTLMKLNTFTLLRTLGS